MTRFALIFGAALGAVLAVPLAPAGADPSPEVAPALERIDLDGVPRVDVDLPHKAFKPVAFKDLRGRSGWAVRLLTVPRGMKGAAAMLQAHIPTPAVVAGRVIVGGGMSSTRVHGFDARSGKLLWTSNLNDNGPSTVAATDDSVYVNTESCTTYGIDARNGRRRWSRVLGPSVMAAPTMAGKRLLAAYRSNSGKYGLVALDPGNGDSVWRQAISADLLGAPVFAEDRIYLTGQDGRVSCLDDRGRLRWSRRISARSTPWHAMGGLYVATQTAALAAPAAPQVMRLDPRDGKTIWRSDSAGGPRTGEMVSVTRPLSRTRTAAPAVTFWWCSDAPRPVVLGSRCVIAERRDLLVLDAGTGERRLHVRLPRGQTFHAPPAVMGENLLYATQQGVLLEVTPSGAVRRVLDLGAPISSQPVVARGRVHVVAGGVLYGIPWCEPDGPEWTQWGGTVDRTGVVEAKVRTR